MARKTSNRKKRLKRYKKYSYNDRAKYYENKALGGATRKEQDFAYGYLDGLNGKIVHTNSSKEEKRGNDAGLRFWDKIRRIKI